MKNQNNMEDKISKIKESALAEITKATDIESLRAIEIKYLGRKGELTMILRGVAGLGEEEKRSIGQAGNRAKQEVAAAVAGKQEVLFGKKNGDFVDVTLPGKKVPRGHLNPITLVQNELEDLFISMGFMVLDGPELESDYYNFTALNIPSNHPARDMQDTFYIDKKDENGEYDMVMRTHTSPVQVRAMQKYGAPLRCVVPGRVFRNEATDASHDTNFYQIEGLMVGEDVSLANLISVLKEVLSRYYKTEVKIRLRPGFFPFVEPGLEVDMACLICQGKGCSSCKHTGWLEMLGAGMVHPNVLLAGKIDPEKYSGFAFGFGLTRMAMMKYGIDDIRHFNSGDLRFLEQF
jgi:phenylalanyl-tRNA synthetase alpha chain